MAEKLKFKVCDFISEAHRNWHINVIILIKKSIGATVAYSQELLPHNWDVRADNRALLLQLGAKKREANTASAQEFEHEELDEVINKCRDRGAAR